MFRTIVLMGIAASVAAVVGHYVIFGPKRVDTTERKRTVRRFRLWERFIHVVTLAGFLALIVTGLIAAIGPVRALHGWLWLIHVAAAPVFMVGLCGLIASWSRDCRFTPHDWEWAKRFGGYLWGEKHAPAERFNGGQKAYLWTVGFLGLVSLLSGLGRIVPVLDPEGQYILYQLHRLSALFFVMAAIVHLYLGTVANPGTFGAMLLGRVTPQWAKNHHPIWWDQIDKKSGK